MPDKEYGAWSNRVILSGALLIAFSLAHALEDFVHGIPAKFGLEVAPAAAMVGIVYAIHVVLIALAARHRNIGYLGNLLFGVSWFLAAALDHFGEVLFASPYRAGAISKIFIVGTMLSGVLLAWVSFYASRSTREVRMFK